MSILKGCHLIFESEDEIHTFADVQSLNEGVQSGDFDIVKISYGNLWNVQDKYGILYSGGAMGYRCGQEGGWIDSAEC